MWLARALIEMGQVPEAGQLTRNALASFEDSLEPGHWRIALAQSTLARVLLETDEFAEAERLLEGSIPVLEDRRGERAQVTLRAIRYLVMLYERTGQAEQAAAHTSLLAERSPR